MTGTLGTAAGTAIGRITPPGYSGSRVGDPDSDLAAVGEAELGEDVLHVVLRGALGQMQLGGDLPVGQTARHRDGDLVLARSQRPAGGRGVEEPSKPGTPGRHAQRV